MLEVKKAQDRHRAEMRRVIIPVAIIGAALVLIPAIMLIAAPQSIGTVSSFMAFLMLVPIVLVCLIPYAILLVMIAGMAFLNRKMSSILDSILKFSVRANRLAMRGSRTVARPVITINKRVAYVEKMTSDLVRRDR